MRKKVIIISIIGVIFLLSLLLLLFPSIREKCEFIFKNIPEKITQKTENAFGVVVACYSPDGINLEKRKNVANFWGGSSGILLKDGTILLGGIDFSHREGIEDKETGYRIRDMGFLASKDGWEFYRPEITIRGLEHDITAWGDPTIVKLPNDSYRMYFTERTAAGPAISPLMSAYSEDGYNYHFEGKVTGEPTVSLNAIDFTVLYEKRAQKYYIYTRSENFDEAQVLESKDGRYFTRRFKIKIPFAFQFSIIDEGDYYVAYGGHLPSDNKPCTDLECLSLSYPVKAVSKDGLHWERTKEQPTGPWAGDRIFCNSYAVIKLNNGYYFY